MFCIGNIKTATTITTMTSSNYQLGCEMLWKFRRIFSLANHTYTKAPEPTNAIYKQKTQRLVCAPSVFHEWDAKQRDCDLNWKLAATFLFPLHNKFNMFQAEFKQHNKKSHHRPQSLSLSLSLHVCVISTSTLFQSIARYASLGLFTYAFRFWTSPTPNRHRKINKQTQYINFITPLCCVTC